MNNYITSLINQFDYYKTAGDKTLQQLSFNEMNYQLHDNSNSVSIIVKHMVGNMLSRWTNFYSEDGEKDWRKRDTEFYESSKNKEELKNHWEKGWNCLFTIIDNLKENDLTKIIKIRNENHTVVEAINRQLAHYPFHIGQLIYIGKMMKDNQWESLSIPKNKSEEFNKTKFNS